MSALHTLVLFTADGCPHSDALREDLTRRNVGFLEVNLSREPHRLQELERWSWEHRLPVVVDHERVSIGFRGGSSTFAEVGLEPRAAS
jgi:glutaredoxin